MNYNKITKKYVIIVFSMDSKFFNKCYFVFKINNYTKIYNFKNFIIILNINN